MFLSASVHWLLTVLSIVVPIYNYFYCFQMAKGKKSSRKKYTRKRRNISKQKTFSKRKPKAMKTKRNQKGGFLFFNNAWVEKARRQQKESLRKWRALSKAEQKAILIKDQKEALKRANALRIAFGKKAI